MKKRRCAKETKVVKRTVKISGEEIFHRGDAEARRKAKAFTTENTEKHGGEAGDRVIW
jgi:hypothetical protein